MLQENITSSSNLNSHNRRARLSRVGNKLNSKKFFHLEGVDVSFGKIDALKNVELRIDKGEVIFLTGASGAGKTTLLKILSGDLTPDNGYVELPYDTQKNVFISKVFQDLRLISKWTCEENLMTAYDSSAYRSKKEFMADMREMAKVLGFSDRLDLKVMNANGGLKQKVAITRALLTKPDVFIADEPTSSLDADNARRIYDVLNLYNTKKGMTVIWASHNKELFKKFTGRIIHLDQGRLVYSGHACFI